MKSNIGKADRMIRFAIAAIIVVLYTLSIITGTLGIILLLVAGVLVVTSLVSFCPLYALLGMDTCKFNPKRKN